MSAGNAVKFARAFVDVANLPAFADGGYRSQTAYAQLSYYAAASLVNQRQYEEAIPYLQSYIRSGEDKYRKTVFINLVKACAASNQYDLAIVTLEQATENYPTDYDFVSAAVNGCSTLSPRGSRYNQRTRRCSTSRANSMRRNASSDRRSACTKSCRTRIPRRWTC